METEQGARRKHTCTEVEEDGVHCPEYLFAVSIITSFEMHKD
jgi:hypothetical protein